MNERTEALMRFVVVIISGIVLVLWKLVIQVIVLFNLIVTLVKHKRNKWMAEFVEIWNTQIYIFLRYMTFVSNKRPFPFTKLEKNMSEFDG